MRVPHRKTYKNDRYDVIKQKFEKMKKVSSQIFVKGNLLQNNNKKMCFLKTYSLLRIEVFYKRIEDTKGKSP